MSAGVVSAGSVSAGGVSADVVNATAGAVSPTRAPLVARWDLDKTYLRTEFGSLSELVARALERPDQKRSVPGATALLAELERANARIHFLSGSPRQLRRKLEAKLQLDGVRFDLLTLKPNLSNLLRFRLRALKDQLGYKLPALLAARAAEEAAGQPAPVEVLFGDDAEADALVYSLYADLLAGRLGAAELRLLLERGHAYADQARNAQQSYRQLELKGGVRRILIHLDQQTPPSTFRVYGARVVPFFNYFQAALVLAAEQLIPPAAAVRVAANLASSHRFDADALVRSAAELARRGALPAQSVRLLPNSEELGEALPPAVEQALQRLRREPLHEGPAPAPNPPSLNHYVTAVEELAKRRKH